MIYRILSLGFEGRYRYEADGPRRHDAVRQRIYNEIMSQRAPVPVPLSPHWQSDVKGRRMSFHDFPVWITSSYCRSSCSACSGTSSTDCSGAAKSAKAIADIGRMTPATAFAFLHLKELLKDRNSRWDGQRRRRYAPQFRHLPWRRDVPAGACRQSGHWTAGREDRRPAIAKVPGKVTVLGYTDNVPIRSRQFASNEALSEERATQVMQLLQSAGVPAMPSRSDR